jgi:hypothetical protein
VTKHFADRIIEDLMEAGESWHKRLKPTDADPHQLEEGINVEFEHTRDPVISMKISLDHLAEHPAYYTALSVMEQLLNKGMLPELIALAAAHGIKPKLRRLSKKNRARLSMVGGGTR